MPAYGNTVIKVSVTLGCADQSVESTNDSTTRGRTDKFINVITSPGCTDKCADKVICASTTPRYTNKSIDAFTAP